MMKKNEKIGKMKTKTVIDAWDSIDKATDSVFDSLGDLLQPEKVKVKKEKK